MAYNTPHTAVAGGTLPAAWWNTDIRDNFETVGKPPYCWLYLTTGLAVPNNVFTTVPWQATAVLRGMTQSGGIVTITEPAIYQVKVLISWNGNVTGLRYARIYKGGAVQHEFQANPSAATGLSTGVLNMNGVMDVQCVAGDTLSVQVLQNTTSPAGGALNLQTGATGASTMQVSVVSR